MEGSKCAASQGVGLTLVWRQRRERGNGGAVFERVWVTRWSAYCIVALAFVWLLVGCARDSGIEPSPTATEATQMPTVDGGQLSDDTTVTPSPTATAEPVETFHTPGGVEYVSGTDGAFKCLESLDESVRVEGPHHIADDLMQSYLDRTHQANAFVADFVDFVPAIGIRFTISPDGTHYIMGRLSGVLSTSESGTEWDPRD